MMKGMLAALLSSLLAAGGVCSYTGSGQLSPSSPDTAPASVPVTEGSWQTAYAALLRESDSKQFYLCDIDGDRIPELFVGGSPIDWDKYAEYDVYTYDEGTIINIGGVSTLSSYTLELDHNHGILSYDYGAGSGEMLRFYKDHHKLCEDGAVYGYYYSNDGQQINWFRDKDGNKEVLSQETGYKCRRLWGNTLTLECYSITEDNIKKVLDGWGSKPVPTAAETVASASDAATGATE